MADPIISANALISLEELAAYLQAPSDSPTPGTQDLRKIRIINRVSEDIETLLDRQLVSRGSLPEYHSLSSDCGGDCDEIKLAEWPATAVASVYEDVNAGFVVVADRYPASTLLAANIDYELIASTREPATQSILRRIGACWAIGRRAIKVTYTAGYASTAAVPQPIKEIALELCALQWRDEKGSEFGVTSRTDATGTITRTLPALLTQSMRDRLASFRRLWDPRTWERAA